MPSSAANPDRLDALPDDQLMLAYAAGDTQAFDALYERHESALFRFVRRLLGMRLAAEVDEVFPATWTRIVSARDSFSPQGASWRIRAFTTAHDLAMDRLVISGRQVAFYAHDEDGDGLEAAQLFSRGLLRDGAAARDAAHPSAEELAFWQAAGRRLLACLDELPDEQRAAFLLHHEEGFTVEAMAAAVGTDAETVRNRLRAGLKKLHGCMERYLSVPGLRMNAADDSPDAPLRRALAHAPDQGALPDWRLGKAIRRQAHDAIGATDPDTDSAELERAARPRWRWKAVLATTLGALLIGVFWWRASAPGHKLEARISQSEPVPASSAPSAPPAKPAAAPVPPAQSVFPPAPSSPPPAPLPPPPPLPFVMDIVPPAPPPVPAPKAVPTVRTDETEPPTFEALSTWTRLTVSRRGGESRSLSRAEARELNALLGSAALSAVGPRPLGGVPEWRVTLERGAESLAVFEIAGAQVRWREGRMPPATGVPSAQALAALRQALQAVVQPPEAALPPERPRNP